VQIQHAQSRGKKTVGEVGRKLNRSKALQFLLMASGADHHGQSARNISQALTTQFAIELTASSVNFLRKLTAGQIESLPSKHFTHQI
jgi:hypothetical protein